MAEGEGGGGGGGGIEAQLIRFYMEARENVSKTLQEMDAVVAKVSGKVSQNLDKMGRASEEAADDAEEGAERFGGAWDKAASAADTTLRKTAASFNKFGGSYAETLKNFEADLRMVGVGSEKAAATFTKSIAGMSDANPLASIERQGTAMSQVLQAKMQGMSLKAKKSAQTFLIVNQDAIRQTIEEYKKFGIEVPKHLKKAEAALDRYEGKISKGKLGRVEDLIGKLKNISVGDTVLGGMAAAGLHYTHARGEETFVGAKEAAKYQVGGRGMVDQRYKEMSNTRIATGANMEELTAINAEFAKMAHLGPQSYEDVAKAAVNLSRTTDMSVQEAAKFTLQLRQMYKMSGGEADEVATKITTLSKLSGVSAGEFAEVYDELKFMRFGLDGNVEAAKRLSDSVAGAAAEMHKYGISSKEIVDSAKGKMFGGVSDYTNKIQALVMAGKSAKEAQALMDRAVGGDAKASEEVDKAIATGAMAMRKKALAGPNGGIAASAVNDIYGGMGFDMEKQTKLAAAAKGELKGPTEKYLENPKAAEAKEWEKDATTAIRSLGEISEQLKEAAAGFTALAQKGVYDQELRAAESLFSAAQKLEGVAGALGDKGMGVLGTIANVGMALMGARALWQVGKSVLGLGKGLIGGGAEAAGAAGAAEAGAAGAAEAGAAGAGAAGAGAGGAGAATAAGAAEVGAAGAGAAGAGGAATATGVGAAGAGTGTVAGGGAATTGVGATLAGAAIVYGGAAVVGEIGRRRVNAEAENIVASADLTDAHSRAKNMETMRKKIQEAHAAGDYDKEARAREAFKRMFGGQGAAVMGPRPGVAKGATATATALPTTKGAATATETPATTTPASTQAAGTAQAADAIKASSEASADSARDIRDYMAQAAVYASKVPGTTGGTAQAGTSGVALASFPKGGGTGPGTGIGTGSGITQPEAAAGAAGTPSKLAQSIATQEGFYAQGKTQNQGQRNNNPGNIRVYGWTPKMDPMEAMKRAHQQGAEGYDPKTGFLKFSSVAAGFKGLDRQLGIYAKKGMNVGQMVEKYAPAKDNNNTAAYKASLAGKGFSAEMPVAQALGKPVAEPVTPPLGVMAARSAPSREQMASLAVPAHTPEAPFTGATQGDQAVVAEVRRGNAILARIASLGNRPGPNSHPGSPLLDEVINGGTG